MMPEGESLECFHTCLLRKFEGGILELKYVPAVFG